MGFLAGGELPQGRVAKWRQLQVVAPCLSWVDQSLLALSCAVIRNLDHGHIQGSLILMPSNNAHPSWLGRGPPQS